MAVIFYNILLLFYRAGIGIASLWNKKAKLWLIGRKDLFVKLKSEIQNLIPINIGTEIIWVHCSSLGEFEQGRPIIEKLKTQYPGSKILITFFSPSGYEIRKDFKTADWVFYLPIDSKTNAIKFLDTVKPTLVIFVKYDYWYHYLTECSKREIPLLLISSIFRKNQPFFQWYGGFHRKMLHCFSHLFLQDENSKNLLNTIKINNVTVAGDTRFDRVISIAENFSPIEAIEKFCAGSKVLVAGSTWPADEKIIREATASFQDLKIIIAPHELDEKHLREIKELFPDSEFYSQLTNHQSQFHSIKYLIIDNIGMLSKLYHYSTISYVGGGFDKGIHNVLEAAVHGKPVIFGPKFEKFKEAIDLKKENAGFSITNKTEFEKKLQILIDEKEIYLSCCDNARNYVLQNRGTTEKIIEFIQLNRLLTN